MAGRLSFPNLRSSRSALASFAPLVVFVAAGCADPVPHDATASSEESLGRSPHRAALTAGPVRMRGTCTMPGGRPSSFHMGAGEATTHMLGRHDANLISVEIDVGPFPYPATFRTTLT